MKKLIFFLSLLSLFGGCFAFGQMVFSAGKQTQTWIHTDPYHVLQFNLYVPPDIQPGKKFPLLIFLHGVGDGANYTTAIQNGPGWFLNNSSWRPEYIIATPVWPGGWADVRSTDILIDSLEKEDFIDSAQIDLLGISAGGQQDFNYVTSNNFYASRIAAMVPMSAANGVLGNLTGFCTNKISVYDFCASGDQFYIADKSYVTAINGCSPGLAALYTINANTHGPWLPFWNPAFNDGSGHNVYWFLDQHRKGGIIAPTPVPVSTAKKDSLMMQISSPDTSVRIFVNGKPIN